MACAARMLGRHGVPSGRALRGSVQSRHTEPALDHDRLGRWCWHAAARCLRSSLSLPRRSRRRQGAATATKAVVTTNARLLVPVAEEQTLARLRCLSGQGLSFGRQFSCPAVILTLHCGKYTHMRVHR